MSEGKDRVDRARGPKPVGGVSGRRRGPIGAGRRSLLGGPVLLYGKKNQILTNLDLHTIYLR